MRSGLIDLNDLAVEITQHEGQSVQVNVAQVSEVLSVTLQLLAEWDIACVAELLRRHQDACKLAARRERLRDRRCGGSHRGGAA